jgi:hypothetical protein
VEASRASLRGWRNMRSVAGAGEGFEQQEDFGGVAVVEVGMLGQRRIAAAAEDGFKGVEQRREVCWEIRATLPLGEQASSLLDVADKHRRGEGGAQPTATLVVLTAVAAVGQE